MKPSLLWRTQLAILLVLAAGVYSAPPAAAGEFPVKQCRGSNHQGFFGEYGQLNNIDRVDVIRGCRLGGDTKVGVYQDRSGALIPQSTGGQFMWAPGTGIRIVGSTITSKLRDVDGMRTYLLGLNLTDGTIDLSGGQPRDGALRTARWVRDGRSAELVVVRLFCVRPAGCSNTPADPRSYFEVSDLEMVAEDFLGPSLTPDGRLVDLGDSGTWVSGEAAFSMTASDRGSGIGRAILEINGFAVDLPVTECSDDRGGYATSFAPCPPAFTHQGRVDTSATPLNEGENSFRFCVVDFAVPASGANRTCTPKRTLLVDNRPPVQPVGLEVVGGGGWRAVNRFEFSWGIPGDQSAPVVAAEYRVFDTADESEVDSGEVASVDPNFLGPLSVPRPGTYRVEVRLRDAAGNLGTAAAVPVRFDDAPPGDVVPEEVGGWVSADELPLEQPIERAAPGGPSGVDGYAVAISRGAPTRPCQGEVCTPNEMAMSGGADDRVAVIASLPEGDHWISAVAASGARIPSRQTGSTIVRVDKTDPVSLISGVPDQWVDRPVTVVVDALDGLSGMEPRPSEDDGVPLTAVAVEGRTPYESVGPQARFTVAAEGATQVRYWARDLAGNVNDGLVGPGGDRHRPPGSAVVRIDTVVPDLGFLGRNPDDPELVSVAVNDSSSGLDYGRISIRKLGSSLYSALRTAVDGDRLLARIPSDDLTPGTYELRAEAVDRAGNTGSTVSRIGGSAMVLSLPLKRPVRVGLARVGKATLRGRVRFGDGRGLSAVRLVAEQRFVPGSRRRVVRVPLRTDGTGRFRLRLRPGPTRSVQVLYAGSRRNSRARSRRLRVAFRDRITFGLGPAKLRNGGRVTMTGAVRGRGAIRPAAGKLVAIEFFDPTRTTWRPVEVIRTGRSGRFRYSYRFRTIAYAQRILFRAKSLSETGWPYLPSTSRPRSVIVYPAGRTSKGQEVQG